MDSTKSPATLPAGTDASSPQRTLNEAIAEYYRHAELGTNLNRTAFLAKFPGLESELQTFLSDVGFLGFQFGKASLDVEQKTRAMNDRTTNFQCSNKDTAWSLGRLKEQEFPIEFGDYDLLSEIDRGGMGIVFRARQRSLPRIVSDTWYPPIRIGMLIGWMFGAWVFQQFSNVQRYRETAQLSWLAFDIAIYTWLMSLAVPPMGLLLIGYPMMICATGMFYRVRYTVIATILSIVAFLALSANVDEPISRPTEYAVIYLSGLALLGLCLVSMIHRVRSLTDYHQN